jgi:GxxExxY protein
MPLQSQEITDKILKIYYKVYNELGYGFLEKVYHNSLIIELAKSGFYYESKKKLTVHYCGNEVGEYYPDIIVNANVIIEIKASEVLVYENECQLINYLRATNIEIGLLLNFGKKPEFRRKFFTNDRKKCFHNP